MNLSKAGKSTFLSSVSNITETGFWLLVDDKEYFVPFANYPEFKRAPVDKVFEVKRLSPTQFYWEAIDCDIELAALEKPEQYPLHFS
jgi:hypothetical protein